MVTVNMNAALTWEILSRLSSPAIKASDDGEVSPAAPDDDGGGLPPFFAQREVEGREETAGKAAPSVMTTATASDSADSPPGMSSTAGDGLPLFLSACPLRIADRADDRRGGDGAFPALYSREAIADEFLRVLRLHRGTRVSSSEMSAWLGMEEGDVESLGDWLMARDRRRDAERPSVDDDGRVWRAYDPSRGRHEYALVEDLRAYLLESINCRRLRGRETEATTSPDGCVPSLEDMANRNLATMSPSSDKNIEGMPGVISAGQSQMSKRISREMGLTFQDASRLLGETELDGASSSKIEGTMQDQLQYLEKRVLAGLSGATVPTSLDRLFGPESGRHRAPEEETAAATTMISAVQSLIEKGMLRGVLSASSSASSAAAAIYTPRVHSRAQRGIADSFYEANGYLTATKCAALGLSRNRMEEFVRESFPNAVLLKNSIIDLNKICRPLEYIIHDAILNKTFADLKSHLPDDISSSEGDVEHIINNQLVALLREQPRICHAFVEGLTLVDSNMAFFFSKDMVQNCKQLLTPLVEEWCKQRAKAIANDEQERDNIAKQDELVPLLNVLTAVGERYPDLRNLQRHHNREHDFAIEEKELFWRADEGSDDGPLVEFCRRALALDELQHTCALSLRAEIKRLDSTRRGGLSVSARTEGAAEIQHIGDSFESSFRILCHLLQIFAKSLDALGARSQDSGVHVVVEEMKKELLLGCGSCLARLVTEYFLFQHAGEVEMEGDVDSPLFFVGRREELVGSGAGETNDLQAIDAATLDFPAYVLRCGPDRNGDPRNLSKYVRSAFPGSAGSSILRMWSLCSESGESDGDMDEVEEGKLELFLRHLSETCLTLVGVPFTMLDKKTERKVLAARREGVLRRLDNSQDGGEVAMCATVLIFHQVKNTPIAGANTVDLALTKLMEGDKKIPGGVVEALRSLKGTRCDKTSSLIARVKKFGAARNSKSLASIADVSE